jgi:UDP-N-acetyl-D-mannosaminuronic acid dehydrogenase
VDPGFIVEKFPEKANLIRAARTVNDRKPEWVAEQVKKDIQDRFGDKPITIGILGLAYKADIDDTRESPALVIAEHLKKVGHKVIACEPNRDEQNIEGYPNMYLEDVLDQAEYVVIATGHRQFRDSLDSICRKPFFDAAGVTA